MNTNINQDGSELIGKRVHQFAINHQISCLVLAYAGKETLHEYLFGLKPRVSSIASKLPRIIRQIMRGIAYMHRAGLVHGDVKSSNIIVSDDRRSSPIPKLTIIDFDLSRPVEANNNNRASFKTNSGTPSYLPPEAFLFDTIDGRKQDMWAIGATIYFLLRQRETYFGIKLRYMFEENIKELFTQHMKRVRDDNKTYLDPITDDMSEMQAWGPLIKVMNDCLRHASKIDLHPKSTWKNIVSCLHDHLRCD
ncbi:kinase-like domain-containing protein [Syncephalis plumigaleata]|nr:kinase-like domain-containing protein [Syncephalis plumigaleata]